MCGTTSWSRSGGAGLALPGDRSALEQLGEEVRLLFEEVLVVGQVVAEQRERLDAGASPEDDLCPATGDGVERGVALEHPDRVVRAQHGDGRAEADAVRPRGDRGEHHVGGRHREVVGVVFADAEEVHADLVGEDALLDDVADRLGMRQRAAVRVAAEVAEGVEAEDEREPCLACGLLRHRKVLFMQTPV